MCERICRLPYIIHIHFGPSCSARLLAAARGRVTMDFPDPPPTLGVDGTTRAFPAAPKSPFK
jgi:hypothetical protein